MFYMLISKLPTLNLTLTLTLTGTLLPVLDSLVTIVFVQVSNFCDELTDTRGWYKSVGNIF